MKRTALLSLLLVVAALALDRQSKAEMAASATTPTVVTQINGFCFLAPYNTVIPCPASPTPTLAPILPTPNKSLALGPGATAVAGVTEYTVTITSKLTCFSLTEPIFVYLLGNTNAAVLRAVSPPNFASVGLPVVVTVDPTTGTATLSLEVLTAAVGPAGLLVKAVWPQEGIEQVAVVIPPTAPTRVPVPSPTATGTVGVTVTGPGGAVTATPTPTPGPPRLTVRACITPNPVVIRAASTLYGLTLPGSTCVASITYSNGTAPSSADFPDGSLVADATGFVSWTLTVTTSVTGGTATVSCVLGAQRASATIRFTVVPPPTPTPTTAT